MMAPLVIVLALTLGWMLFTVSALLGCAAWLVYLWAVRTGQFQDIEEPARRMLQHDLEDGR
jgi:cbb3-type cytochrome oxidase maturation protein